jgi:hypothetical protein
MEAYIYFRCDARTVDDYLYVCIQFTLLLDSGVMEFEDRVY